MIAVFATEVLGIIAGSLAVAGIIARVIWNTYRWARRIEDAITYVEAEMKVNGGTTTRDAIHRIERHLGIAEGWDGLTERRSHPRTPPQERDE